MLAIYAAAYFVQFALDALRARGWLVASIVLAFGLCAAAMAVVVVRERPGPLEVLLLLAAAGVYALLVHHLDIVQERIHLLEYGAVGALFLGALRERWRPARLPAPRWWQRSPAVAAIVLATAAGWGDELVQGALPNRHYDLRDVLTNAEAAALLVVVLTLRRRLRAARAARRGERLPARPAAPSR